MSCTVTDVRFTTTCSSRAGKHLDGKNTAGSYSALVVCETGAAPFAGGFYLLPQYHKALDMRQGEGCPLDCTLERCC